MINGVKHCFYVGMLYHGSKDFVLLPLMICGEGYKHRDVLCLLICNGVFYKMMIKTTIQVTGIEVAYVGSLFFSATSVFLPLDFQESSFSARRRPVLKDSTEELLEAFGEKVTEK